MFEDRSRKKKNGILLIILMIVSITAALGLFFNSNDNTLLRTSREPNKPNNYQVPENLVRPSSENNEPTKQIVNNMNEYMITPNTVLVFEINFQLCGHTKIKKSAQALKDEVNLTEEQLKIKYQDWEIVSFEPEKIVLKKAINTHCPEHFIIGVKGEGIAVYKYNIDGQKVLMNETDIQISTLTPEDQEIIKSGIVADTEDELQGILEGFSD